MIGVFLLLLLHTVEGRVTFRGTPLPGATVVLTNANGTKAVTVTDAEGRYRFDGVADGFELTAEIEGFAVRKLDGTAIDMKATVQESECRGYCDDGWDHPPLEEPARFSPPHVRRLPVARGFAGALELAPGVH